MSPSLRVSRTPTGDLNMKRFVTRYVSAALLMVLSGAACAENATTLEKLALDALDRLNQRRVQIGLAPLQRNEMLDRSASAHARYITGNRSLGTEGHMESPGRPGYTGVTPAQRMVAAGYTGNSTAENMALISYPLGALSTDDLIDAPYHRQSQFGSYQEAGVAMSTQPAPQGFVNPEHYIYVINFGGKISSNDKGKKMQPFVYPVHGQKDVPADWIANESPNPLPDMAGQRVGYPISVAADPGDTLQIKTFKLIDANGAEVAGRLITTHTNDGKPLDNYAFWIPLKPLAYGMAYQVHAQGTLNGAGFSSKWGFATRGAAPLQLTPSAPQVSAEAGAVMTVKLSGGTGSNFAVTYGGQRYQYFGKVSPKVSFVTASYPAPDLLILTRNSTPCAINVTSCEIIIKGKDASGSEISLALPVN